MTKTLNSNAVNPFIIFSIGCWFAEVAFIMTLQTLSVTMVTILNMQISRDGLLSQSNFYSKSNKASFFFFFNNTGVGET